MLVDDNDVFVCSAVDKLTMPASATLSNDLMTSDVK